MINQAEFLSGEEAALVCKRQSPKGLINQSSERYRHKLFHRQINFKLRRLEAQTQKMINSPPKNVSDKTKSQQTIIKSDLISSTQTVWTKFAGKVSFAHVMKILRRLSFHRNISTVIRLIRRFSTELQWFQLSHSFRNGKAHVLPLQNRF